MKKEEEFIYIGWQEEPLQKFIKGTLERIEVLEKSIAVFESTIKDLEERVDELENQIND